MVHKLLGIAWEDVHTNLQKNTLKLAKQEKMLDYNRKGHSPEEICS